MINRNIWIFSLSCTITLITCTYNDHHRKEVIDWRKERIAELTAPLGWTSLVGLKWLDEGTTWIGHDDKTFQIRKSVSDTIGSVSLDSSGLHFNAYRNKQVMLENELVSVSKMYTDKGGNPSIFSHKQYYWTIIERDSKLGLRVWDTTHIGRTKYLKLDYYDIISKFRVEATFEPFDKPKIKPVKNILGMNIDQIIPGVLTFQIDGKEYSLEPIETTTDQYFLIIQDETTGGDTYGGGRYLYCQKPDKNNITTIDFNKSFTPPCGFTEFATCLLPTKENSLDIEILAGERYLEDH